jgi:hypothetical protein
MKIIEKKAYELDGQLFHTEKDAKAYYEKYLKEIVVGDFVSLIGSKKFTTRGSMYANAFEPQGYVIDIEYKKEGVASPDDGIKFLVSKHGSLPKELLFDKSVEKRLTRNGLQFFGKNVGERHKGYTYKVELWLHPRRRLVRGQLESNLISWN